MVSMAMRMPAILDIVKNLDVGLLLNWRVVTSQCF